MMSLNQEDLTRVQRRLYSKYRSQAKHRGLPFNLGRERFTELTESPCAYCGAEPSNRLKYQGLVYQYSGLDRIDAQRGYEAGNVLPSCGACNSLRGFMKFEDWADFLRGVVETHGGEPAEWMAKNHGRETRSFYRG